MEDTDYNLSFLCKYYTSSRSRTHTGSVGSPLDGSRSNSRYSFCTEREVEAFIHIELPTEIYVNSIRIRPYSGFENPCIPILASKRSEEEIDNFDFQISNTDTQIDIDIFSNIKSLRLTRADFGALSFSSIEILSFQSEIIKINDSLDCYTGLTLTYAPWFGLGGGLSVAASAAGAVERSHAKKFQSICPSNNYLSYPSPFVRDEDTETFVRSHLSRSAASELFSDPNRYKSDRPITWWTYDDEPSSHQSELVLISRDHLKNYQYDYETSHECMQRLYSRLIPSSIITDAASAIARRFNLNDSVFDRALGVHVRHGNGERYYSAHLNQWGVKPPSKTKILSAIEKSIKESNIETIILCSDCYAVAEVIESHFRDMINVVFISETVQEIGAGCNHIGHTFNRHLPRTHVSRDYDDVRSFSEILLLSKCNRLCGGNSFFFRAAIGFSKVESKFIFPLDNSDRYANLNAKNIPISEINDIEIRLIYNKMINSGYRIDGLFLERIEDGGVYRMTFYDEELFMGTLNELEEYIFTTKYRESIMNIRLYV
uniref:nodulation protein NodZ n=1 Tax=Stappia sp. TaxID=1870903 RepID=UPI003BAA2996